MVHWFQGSFPDGCLGDEVLTGALSLGAHLGGPRRGCHRLPLLWKSNLSLIHRPRYPHTPDHNHQITNYHHLYPLPSPHISLLTSFPRRLVSRLYAILYLLPYLLESWSSNVPFLQEPDKDCYLPLCELYMVISVGSHLFEYSFCLC